MTFSGDAVLASFPPFIWGKRTTIKQVIGYLQTILVLGREKE
jgi:hypothetical protein